MPKSKDSEGHEEHERRERSERRPGHERHEDEHSRPEDRERPRRRRMGREHAVHQEIVNRRKGGGAPPTPEAYARALQQWQQLPGSIVRPPTDEKPVEPPAPQSTDENANED